MKNNKDEKVKLTFRRLILAKELFLHGIEHSNNTGALNKIIAIHNFHNSIEIILRAIILDYEIRPEKQLNIDFETMLNQIDNFDEFKTSGKRLPYRQEMRNLNQLRNMVQHHAVEPETSTVEDWRVFSKRFIERTLGEYFNTNFEELSSIIFISDDRLRSILKDSEGRIKKNDYKNSIILTKAAFQLALSKVTQLLPDIGRHDAFHASSRLRFSRNRQSEDLIRVIEDIFSRIYRAEHFAAILASGISLPDYKKFMTCTPSVNFTDDSNIYATFSRDFSEEDCKWSYKFVVDAIIKWQGISFEPSVPEWFESDCEDLIREK